MSSELCADRDDRASSDLVVIVVVFDLDVNLHLQSWYIAEDFVELVEFFFRQLKTILKMKRDIYSYGFEDSSDLIDRSRSQLFE